METANIEFNSKYEILTPDGWSNFKGIKRTKKEQIVKIIFSENLFLECSKDHPLLTLDGFKLASELTIEDVLVGENENLVFIKTIEINYNINDEYFYDVLDVEKNNVYYSGGIVSHNCSFIGSSGTLISGSKLSELIPEAYLEPSYGPIRIYDRVKKDHKYVATLDVSRGKGLDFSAISIFDVTQMPFKQVLAYKNNQITPLDFSFVALTLIKQYNNAFVLTEINDIGEQVSQSLFFDHGYEYIISTSKLTHGNKRVTVYTGNSKNPDRGLRMTTLVKKIGCMQLKLLIEQNQLLIPDVWTIDELKTFSKRANSWEAEEGKHDDLVMTLVIFSWLTLQPWFVTYFEKNALIAAKELNDEEEELNMAMFGLIDNSYKEPHQHFMQNQEVIFHNTDLNTFDLSDINTYDSIDFSILK